MQECLLGDFHFAGIRLASEMVGLLPLGKGDLLEVPVNMIVAMPGGVDIDIGNILEAGQVAGVGEGYRTHPPGGK